MPPPTAGRRILINVPILNEIENIERLITGVSDALRGYDYVLLIVDDGSTDGTLEYVERAVKTQGGQVALLNRQKTRGGCQRGAALLTGLKWALANGDFDIFVEMDGDLSHRPEELPRGIEAIARGEADIAIVSKYIAGSKVTGRSLGRTLISLICNFAVRSAIQWNILDFSNGYRFYSRAAGELVSRHSIRYGSPIYLSEAMAIWLKHRLNVVEIPGHYVGRNEGLSKVRVLDYVKASLAMIEISYRFRVTGFARVDRQDVSQSSAFEPRAGAESVAERDG